MVHKRVKKATSGPRQGKAVADQSKSQDLPTYGTPSYQLASLCMSSPCQWIEMPSSTEGKSWGILLMTFTCDMPCKQGECAA